MCSPPERISPHCPSKSNKRPANFLILTLRCAVWLCSVMHTAELDSAVWCTVHTAKLDSVVGCTPWSLTPQYDTNLGAWLLDVMHTAILIILGHFTLWWDAHCGAWFCRVWLSNVHHTAERRVHLEYILRIHNSKIYFLQKY